MNKFSTLLVCCAIAASAQAQDQTLPATQPYGKVDQADLELKQCDFEKDANAEVLFEKANVYFGADLESITEEVHKRVKIFNDNGKGEADVHIEFISENHLEYITGIQAETINLADGKTEITKLDRKSIYTKSLDKVRSEVTFTLPNVKPGSIIEYKYNWNSKVYFDMPVWYFQEKIPVRYNELDTNIPDVFYFRPQMRAFQSLAKYNTSSEGRSFQDNWQDSDGHSHVDSYPYSLDITVRGMTNIPSLPDESYMSSFRDNVEAIRFQLISVRPIGGFANVHSDTWAKVGGILADDDDFGGQLNRKLNNEESIIAKAKTMKSDEDKIAYIFNEVKNTMKWNNIDSWYADNGTPRAWENKTGNSAEINLILYHLLKKSGVDAYPMVVSTRDHGKVVPYYTTTAQFNRAVVLVPVDSTKQYVLDATGKYNAYDVTPAELLNSSGLFIDKAKKLFDIIYLQENNPVRQVVMINGEIKPDGKLIGKAQISSKSYDRINAIQRYKTDGEKKYMDYLSGNDNNLKISSIKFENMDVDTLPLTQNVDFNLDLAGSDENYIYLNPNIFTPFKTNPFLAEKRMTDIDFGYPMSFSINGVYKIPAGYKTDALPKSIILVMPDKSITFKRMVLEDSGNIIIRYNINFAKAEYSKDNYPDFHEFFKKMHEMLNEQVILKKS